MKYLAITAFAIASMAFGFVGMTAIPAQAGDKCLSGSEWDPDAGPNGACVSERYGEITDIDSLTETAYNGEQFEGCSWSVNQDGVRMCSKTDENGNERVAGVEVPDGVEVAYTAPMTECVWNQEKQRYDCPWSNPSLPKAAENEGEQVACQGGQCIGDSKHGGMFKNENFEPVKTASGTFYPLPMMTVAEMDKLLAPGGTSVASFDKILAPGGTAVESDFQFADRENGSGGDFGESGGDGFGEGDRAAASTAAE